MKLMVDETRTHHEGATGIYVRALLPDGTWDSADIAELTAESLDTWLRSRDNIEWPISVVKLLLGHRQEEKA